MVDLTRIPRDNPLSRQIIPDEPLRVPEYQAGGARYAGRQVEALGEAGREFAQAYQREQLRSSRFQMQADLETFRGNQDVIREQTRRTAPPGAPNFTDRYLEQFDQSADNIRTNIPAGMEVEFNARLAAIRRQAQVQAYAAEQTARDAHEKGQIGQQFNNFAIQVDQDPGQRADLTQRAQELIRLSGLSAEEKLAMARAVEAQLAEAEYQNLVRRDPQQAQVALGGNVRITNPHSLNIIGRIQAEARAMGIPDAQVQALVGQFYIENPRFNPTARTPSGPGGSYVFGLGQTTRALREKYGITEDTSDPDFIKKMIRGSIQAMQDHATEYAELIGVDPSTLTNGQRYLAYFQGPAGLKAIVEANADNPNTSVGQALAAGVSPRHAAMVMRFNHMLRNMTVAQLLNWAERRVNNGIAATGGIPDATMDVADPRFAAIPAERRTVLRNQARSLSEHTEALDHRLTSHFDVERQNEVYKQGLDLVRKNELSEQWLIDNRANLQPSAYNQFNRVLSGQDDPRHSEPSLLAELRAQAANPDTAQEAIRRAVEETGNRISNADFKYVLEHAQSTLNAQNKDELRTHSQTVKLIGDRLYSSLAPTTSSRFDRTAIVEAGEARRQLQEWGLRNRSATPEEVANKAAEIQEAILTTRNERAQTQAGVTRAAPRALQMLGIRSPSQLGNVAPEAFAKAYQQLANARKLNQIDDETFRFLNINLREFERQAEIRRAARR